MLLLWYRWWEHCLPKHSPKHLTVAPCLFHHRSDIRQTKTPQQYASDSMPVPGGASRASEWRQGDWCGWWEKPKWWGWDGVFSTSRTISSNRRCTELALIRRHFRTARGSCFVTDSIRFSNWWNYELPANCMRGSSYFVMVKKILYAAFTVPSFSISLGILEDVFRFAGTLLRFHLLSLLELWSSKLYTRFLLWGKCYLLSSLFFIVSIGRSLRKCLWICTSCFSLLELWSV